MKKRASIFVPVLILIMLLLSGIFIMVGSSEVSAAQTTHDTIYIDDNGGFASAFGVAAELIDAVNDSAPTITAHSPVGNDVPVNYSLKTTIYVYFSEAMNTSSVHIDVNGVDCTLNWAVNATFITPFRPSYNTTYSVNVTGEDLAGNTVAYSWSFTTMKDEGKIDGAIIDANGGPIANATITLSVGMVAKTDTFGHFSFSNVTAGSYNMSVSKDGYQTITQEVNTTAGQTNDLGFLAIRVNSSSSDLALIIGMLAAIAAVIVIGFIAVRKRKM